MPRPAGTPEHEALGHIFRRHRELTHPEMTQEAAAEMAGVSLSVYDNIEKGRYVSVASLRKAAKGMRLPGGIPRVEAIVNGDPDPGPGLAVINPRDFHPAATEEAAQYGRLTELVARFEQALRHSDNELSDRVRSIESQLGALRGELKLLADRIPESEKKPAKAPARKQSSR